MKASRFNWPVVRRLVLKDWYIHRWLVLFTLTVDALFLYTTDLAKSPISRYEIDLDQYGGRLEYYGNTISGFMLFFLHNALMLVLAQERQRQTMPFVTSLPIRPRDYVASKLLANLLLFLIPWATLLLALIFVIRRQEILPDGLIPFVVIMLLATLAGCCLYLGLAATSEANLRIVAAMLAGTLLPFLFRSWVSCLPEIAATATSNDPTFSGLELGLVAFLLVVIGLGLAWPFYGPGRQSTFA